MRRFAGYALVAALIVGGCAPRVESGVKLTVWGWRTDDVAAYNTIFEKYEARNPGVDVEYQAFKNTEYNTILQTGLGGDSGPDLAQLRAYGELQPVIASELLLPLDGEIDALEDFAPTTLDGARSRDDNRVYGVPFAIQTLHVIYNKNIFSEQGLKPPDTWADMITAAERLQQVGVDPFAVTVRDDWMLTIEHEIFGASRYGGTEFRDRVLRGDAEFTDPDFVASIETFAATSRYWQPKFTGIGYDDAKALFASGRAAMFPGGVWELAEFRTSAPDIELGIFQVPPAPDAVADTAITPGYTDGSFGVSARSRHRAEALDLAAWMAGTEFGQAFSDALVQLSAVPGTKPKDPLLKQALHSYQANPGPYMMYADFSYGSPSGAELLRSGLSDVLLGRRSAADVAAALQRGVEQWHKPRG